MKKLLSITAIILVPLLILVAFVTGILFERRQANGTTKQVDSNVVVEQIQNEAFLVTKTIYLDEDITIKIDQGSDWSNFWWGQEISAEGIIRTDVGVDFTKINSDQVKVDQITKTITITLPSAEILDSSLFGSIKLTAKNGVLKYLFANDPNKDHNLALTELVKKAKDDVNKQTELMSSARVDTQKMLRLVLLDTGYTVIFKDEASGS